MPKVYNKYHGDAPASAVYIGRPSRWGNPFTIGSVDGGREQVIQKYRQYLREHPELIMDIRQELAGKDLVCFCKPRACHSDVILAVCRGEDP